MTDHPHGNAPTLQAFLEWPVERVAERVRGDRSRVCVFPVNGTRRWFMLEYPAEAASGSWQAYLEIAGRRHVELYQLFFDHGLDTLLTPIFGPDLLERGEAYRKLMMPALLWFAQDPTFVDFYERYDVRVRVYGDARRFFHDTPYEEALDAFDVLARRTADHRRHRLFFGVCAHDPAETVAEFGVQFHQAHGHPPNKRQIVEAYYGEYIEPVDLFIGFDRPSAFDMPLVATGSEDLYFTVSPSPYVDQGTLRRILYDHLYARQVDDADYAFSEQDTEVLGRFYRLNQGCVLGLGRKHHSGAFWYPVPQVTLPPDLQDD